MIHLHSFDYLHYHLYAGVSLMVLRVLYLHKMDDIQQEYRDRMTAILSLRASPKVKSLLLESLNQEMRSLIDLSLAYELSKCRAFEVMSTSYSECPSTNYQMEKDVEEL